jgi:hypothetical protein
MVPGVDSRLRRCPIAKLGCTKVRNSAKNIPRGYTKDNVQLVTKLANRHKLDLPTEDFIELCYKVARYRLRTCGIV